MTALVPQARTIVSLCDRTGNWSQPYREAGYRVVTVDMQSAADARPGHVNVDVRMLEHLGPVHGVLAAPPCTYFANSGARWPRTREQMLEALSVVDACLRVVAVCKPEWWALENPAGKLVRWLGPPSFRFQPFEYGDPYTKLTYLWGSFTAPPKRPVHPSEGSKMHRLPPGPERVNLRSITPMGFARAFFEANP